MGSDMGESRRGGEGVLAEPRRVYLAEAQRTQRVFLFCFFLCVLASLRELISLAEAQRTQRGFLIWGKSQSRCAIPGQKELRWRIRGSALL